LASSSTTVAVSETAVSEETMKSGEDSGMLGLSAQLLATVAMPFFVGHDFLW